MKTNVKLCKSFVSVLLIIFQSFLFCCMLVATVAVMASKGLRSYVPINRDERLLRVMSFAYLLNPYWLYRVLPTGFYFFISFFIPNRKRITGIRFTNS